MKTPLSFFAVAVFLALHLGAIAQTSSRSSQKLLVVPPGAGVKSYPGEWKITGPQSNELFAMVEITVPTARENFNPLHVHTREDEAWYVIEGELTFEVGERIAIAGPGTFVWAPRDIPHHYRASKAPARYLLMVCPAGVDRLFAEDEEISKKFPQGSPAFNAELQKLQPRYGTSIMQDSNAVTSSASNSPRQMLVVPPGAGMKSHPGEWKIMGSQSNGALAIVEINASTAREDSVRPLHVHTREDEGWYVIEGELTFEVGDQTATAGPGTFVWAARDVPHRYRPTKVPARWLLMLYPAGMEPLFAEVDDLRKRVPPGTPEYEAELHKLQAKYGGRSVTESPTKKP